MFAGAAVNFANMLVVALIAMATAFIPVPEVSALLAACIFPFLFYHIANVAGDNYGDYRGAVKISLMILLWIIVVFSIIYWRHGLIVDGEYRKISLLESFYFSVTTWTTLGYGDMTPPPRLRHITSIEALLGYTGMGVWVAVIGLWIAQRTQLRKEIHEHNEGTRSEAGHERE